MKHLVLKIVAAAVSCIVLVIIGLKLSASFNSTEGDRFSATEGANSGEGPSAKSRFDSFRIEWAKKRGANQVDGTSKRSKTLNLSNLSLRDFRASILTLYQNASPEEIENSLFDFGAQMESDQDALAEFLAAGAEELMELERESALHFLSLFTITSRATSGLESQMVELWLEQDSDDFFATLSKGTVRDHRMTETLLESVAKVTSARGGADFEKVLEVVSQVDGETDWSLKRGLYYGLAQEAPAQQRQQVFEQLNQEVSSEPRLRSSIAKAVSNYAKEDPSGAKGWLYQIDDVKVRRLALKSFLRSVPQGEGLSKGVEILNSESFFDDFYADHPKDSPQFKLEYDANLEALLAGSIQSDPAFVISAAENFYNEEMKKGYQRAALLNQLVGK